jgi:FkbM family methyltransferase
MLNLELGSPETVDGRSYIVTRKGRAGHAVYGPYDSLEPGDYVVEFTLDRADDEAHRSDFRCAVLDVVRNSGNDVLARSEIFVSQLRDGRRRFAVTFGLKEPSRLEYRVWVSGKIPLVVDEYRLVSKIPSKGDDPQALLAAKSFPDAEGEAIPFFQQNRAMLRDLYEKNIGVRIFRDSVVLTVNGISLYARSADDLTFIGEIFYESAYNFTLGRDVCVIDIGMNIGLATLTFASKAEVRQVHSFEPFRNTYDRAVENLSLNPDLSAKVRPTNCGLSDQDSDGDVLVSESGNSGSMSTVGIAQGTPVHLSLKDAGPLLRPIITEARAQGLDVVVKMDCEGSEFGIFRSLAANGLLSQISAFMVEWHAMFDDKTQEDLIAPLRDNGFIVFDRSPPSGNGFFYAARLHAPAD